MFASGPRALSYSESYGRGGGREERNGERQTMREPSREKKAISIHPYDSPLDRLGHPVSVPMRSEVIKLDGSNAEVTEDLQEFFLMCLREAAQKSSVEIDELGEIRMHPIDKMKQTRWVCHFKVSCTNWQSALSHFACTFHNLIRNDVEWEILRHDMPIIYTHSKLLYPLRLINMHKDIPFKRIKFGSFINSGSIGIHWILEGGFATDSDRADGFNFYKDINASFEYDRRQLTIYFHNRECDPEDAHEEFVPALYKLTIDISSIRKIGVDAITLTEELDRDDEYYGRTPRSQNRQSLILTVDYPPKIQVKLKNKTFPGRRDRDYGEYEHRLEIHRGRYPGEISNRQALHESKLIILEFDEEYITGKLTPPNSTLDQLIFDIVSRLRHKTGKAVEYTSFDQMDMLEGRMRKYYDEYDYRMIKVNPYGVERDFDDYVIKLITNASTVLVSRTNVRSDIYHHINLKVFRLHALLQGILQRGMEIRCQLLINRGHWYAFVRRICERYKSNEQRTLLVMENLLSIISEGRPHCSVWNLFEKEWEDSRLTVNRTTVFTEEDKRNGFTRLMKFVITPTRLLFVGYETIMANRVLRQNSGNGTEIVRVSFRDENGEFMRESSTGEKIVLHRMKTILMKGGFKFAGRTYSWLGNSNSQLRDFGFYAFHETETKTVRDIRRKLGNFYKLKSIPKVLARLGQCFTQARESSNRLSISQVGMKCDIIGGLTDKGEPYCFSDGVGTISYFLADKLSNEHSLTRTPSAFQIRHKGQKGLITVDPIIDKRNDLLKEMNRLEDTTEVFVRPSMDKFEVEETSRSEQAATTNLEIVKYSMPCPLFLNRPLINILSQVSEDQSPECHRRMSNRIEDLLDMQLKKTAQSLYIEKRARETIKDMSFPIATEVFSDANPLRMTSEPFFRSLLRANAKFVLHKQLSRMQIRIPDDFGRSMFGVVDTTGILQYGQIFCQYSPSTSKHMMTRSRNKNAAEGVILLKGPVMMTKNPCHDKGDVRRFEAIDVPGLRHLVDVVVFPMHGPRPHPDEMAGSDLDGDEYSLIWDSQLLFDHNEEASLFPSGEDVINWPIIKTGGVVDIEACERRLADFYIEATTQEQIGVLSHAHLATSDFYGLDNKASRSLAYKISQSLDFQKNGVRPDKLTDEAEDDPEDETRVIPPEKAVRKPDYMEKMRDAGYESRGVMGKVFREIKRYQHAIDTGEDQIDMIEKDPSFNLPGWEKYKGPAATEMEKFTHEIRSIMEHYGIVSEGELMSGQIITIKNRISDKEADDMNLFNTNMVIEEKVKREIIAARTAFFAPLIQWDDENEGLERVEYKRRDVAEDSILCRIVRSSTKNIDKIRLKAAACYNVCYDAANRQLENGDDSSMILSFPWIFYDVLADIKLRPDDRIVRVLPVERTEQSNEPLAVKLSVFIEEYCENEENHDAYLEFKAQFDEGSMIGRFLNENDGLARASFVLSRWANHIGGINEESKFSQSHLVALFIQFGLGEVKVRGTTMRYIQRPTGEPRAYLKKGEHLLKFIEYVSSREFRSRADVSFKGVMEGVLIRGEWRAFGELCIPAFLSLVTTHRIDLPMEEEADTRARRSEAIIKEFEPRKMELPRKVVNDRLDEVKRDLLKITRCRDIQLRPMGNSTEVFVSALGSTESCKALNALVVSPAPSRNDASKKDIYKGIPSMVYQRLLKVASEAPPLPSL